MARRTLRRRLARRLRFAADRIDPTSGPRAIGYSFRFLTGVGIVFDDKQRTGAPLWVMAEDYDQAFRE